MARQVGWAALYQVENAPGASDRWITVVEGRNGQEGRVRRMLRTLKAEKGVSGLVVVSHKDMMAGSLTKA